MFCFVLNCTWSAVAASFSALFMNRVLKFPCRLAFSRKLLGSVFTSIHSFRVQIFFYIRGLTENKAFPHGLH